MKNLIPTTLLGSYSLISGAHLKFIIVIRTLTIIIYTF